MSDELLAYQKSYLLLLFYQAKSEKLACGELKKKLQTKTARESLDFNETSLHQVLEGIVGSGDVCENRRPKNANGQYPARGASYALTEQGKQRLFASKQYPTVEVKMKGEMFNAFMDAVKESPFWDQTATPKPETAKPEPTAPPSVPVDLTAAILDEFRELLREKYSHTGMVPIHEVRRRIAERCGVEAARHDSFDEQVHQLRRENRLDMVPISFLGDATPEQLNDSLPGVNETFFYLEPAQDEYSIR